jgi:hypothetical protein
MTSHISSDNQSLSMAKHPDIQGLDRDAARRTAVSGAVQGLALLAGGYAAISAWVVGFQDQSPLAVTNLIVGAAIALLALTALRERQHVFTGAYALMGVWLVVAPWVVQHIDHSAAVIVSNVIVGAVIALAGALVLALGTLRIGRR